MSTAEATRDRGPVLDHPPKQGDKAAPREQREHEGQRECVSASEDIGRSGGTPLKSIIVLEVAWLAFLGYLTHILLF